MSLLTDVADVLSSGGVTAPIFKGTLPSTPDVLVGLFETGGGPPVHAMRSGPGALTEYPHVQLVARTTRPDDSKKLAQDCWRLLDGLGPRAINGVAYGRIVALQSPFFLQVDEQNRPQYVCNFEATKSPASSS